MKSKKESGKNLKPSSRKIEIDVGDIWYSLFDNQYHIFKILAIDYEFECFHVLTYKPLDKLPIINALDNLDVFVYHSPFDKQIFSDAIFLIKKEITAKDLVGYHEYLRLTQSPDYYIPIAENYYETAFNFTNEKRHIDAIDSYTKAIDLFPQFYEAIDNRAFCKMDLGLWAEAIEDFKLSLQQNPNSLLAEFSIGECYFQMGDLEKAKIQFEIAEKIDPNHQAPKQFLNELKQMMDR